MNQPVSESQPHPEIRKLRHDLRGQMNAIVLCASAIDPTMPEHEALEFLGDIEKATDRLLVVLEKLESMSD